MMRTAAKLAMALALLSFLAACASPAPTSIQRELLSSAKALADRGDLSGAVREYRQLAESGVVQAQYRLGQAYLNGSGVDHNVQSGIQWLSLAAGAGDIPAMRELGELHSDPESEVYDPPVAARWYATAAEKGDETARFALAELAISSAQSPADQELAIQSLREGARNGYVRAQLRLANAFETGKIVPKDTLEAQRWYAIAANVLEEQTATNDTRAQVELAKLFISGRGVAADPLRAISLLESASAQGRMSATISLAKLYRNGMAGLPKDNDRAVYWRDQAVRRNHASSAYELGKWFMRGDGVIQDPIRAKGYFEQAAQWGETRSFIYLGEILGGKFEELTDYPAAADWYQLASDEGSGKAMFKLAELHEKARLGDASNVQALALYRAAASSGYSRGKSRAERLSRNLSAQERSQADEVLSQILANET